MRDHSIHQSLLIALAVCALVLLGACQQESTSARTSTGGEMVLQTDQGQVTTPLKMFDLHLTGDDAFPETFEMKGDGVCFAGIVPPSIRVGYGCKWENLIAKPIALDSRSRTQIGTDLLKAAKIELPKEALNEAYERYSTFALPGKPVARVLGGVFMVEKVTGKYGGLDGDKTLHGKIEIRIQDGAGEKLFKGAFKVRCITWG